MRIHVSRSFIPNLFTVLNIFFGFLCMTHAFQGHFVLAAWYIVLSALADALDGFMARLTNSASDFGVELDSLADVVSFGAAPAIFVYFLFLHEFGGFGMLIAAMQLILGALRLARFNVQLVGFTKEYFTGMPIPLAALISTSFIIFLGGTERLASDIVLRYAYIGIIVMNAALMVSTIRYPVLPKFSKYEFKHKPVRTSLFVVAGIIIIATLGKGLFPVLFIVGITGPLAATYRKLMHSTPAARRRMRSIPDEPDDQAEPAVSDSH